MAEDPSLCVLFKNRPIWTASFIVEFSPVTGQFCLVISASSQDLLLRLQGLRGTSVMHVSLLPLNRLLQGDIPFNTELRVRLVDGEDLAQVEFRNTLKDTDRTRLLCKFYLKLPSLKMPSAVSVTYHFKLEHFNCSNLLPVEKVCVSYLTEFSQCLIKYNNSTSTWGSYLVLSHFQFPNAII